MGILGSTISGRTAAASPTSTPNGGLSSQTGSILGVLSLLFSSVSTNPSVQCKVASLQSSFGCCNAFFVWLDPFLRHICNRRRYL